MKGLLNIVTQAPQLLNTEEDIKAFFLKANDIITKKNGEVEATEEQRKVCLMFPNGDFLVAQMHLNDPIVRSLREVCERKGVPRGNVYLTDKKIIRLIYEEAESNATGDYKSNGNYMPMEKMALQLIAECTELGVSDLHIRVGAHEAEIFTRHNGDMIPLRQLDSDIGHALLSSLYNAAEDSDATYRIYAYQAARVVSTSRFKLPHGLQSIRLQFNPVGQGGRYLVARFLYSENELCGNSIDLVNQGFHPIQARMLAQLRQIPEGVNIVSGPTGSGKSTTLKSILELIYKEKMKKVNLLSIEDPPEYEINGAVQLSVTNVDSEEERAVEFRKAIVAALRSDPDVIMPGEARDEYVIGLVFTAAMTGHQVWTSLHANNAIAIFDRLKDQGVDDYKLTDPNLLTGLVSQRLLKLLCPQCSQSFLSGNVESKYGFEVSYVNEIIGRHSNKVRLVNESGCGNCKNGYIGRTAVAEVIIPDQEFLNLISSNDRVSATKYWLESLNGMAIKEHAWLKIINGLCDPFDVLVKMGRINNFSLARKEKLLTLQ